MFAESVIGVNPSKREIVLYVIQKSSAKIIPCVMATTSLEPFGGRVRRIPGVRATKRAVKYRSMMTLDISS
jgi:hypothetical protein